MGWDPQLWKLLQQMYGHIIWQNEKMYTLELLLTELRDEIRLLRSAPSTRVDKIEYTFDQLKVENLEGTLQIGITPEGVKSLEDLSVGGKPQIEVQPAPEPDACDTDDYRRVREDAESFVLVHVPAELMRLEAEFGFSLTDRQRRAVVDDLLRQARERSLVYWRMEAAAGLKEAKESAEAAEKIAERLRLDILSGLRQFAERNKHKEEDSQ